MIVFTAGPPYEDIAFRIVRRPWEYSHRKGFRSMFDRGVLQRTSRCTCMPIPGLIRSSLLQLRQGVLQEVIGRKQSLSCQLCPKHAYLVGCIKGISIHRYECAGYFPSPMSAQLKRPLPPTHGPHERSPLPFSAPGSPPSSPSKSSSPLPSSP